MGVECTQVPLFELTEEGVVLQPCKLRERTLVALCGGVCKFGNVRFSAGRVEVTGLLGLLTSFLGRRVGVGGRAVVVVLGVVGFVLVFLACLPAAPRASDVTMGRFCVSSGQAARVAKRTNAQSSPLSCVCVCVCAFFLLGSHSLVTPLRVHFDTVRSTKR